ncbi:MAG: cell division protein FtsQ/DivIB [Rubrivivax sp.]|nr:cell division protein FtsQ/DivIB [Rubrivivax sp.]
MATARLTRPATRAALPLVLPGDVRLMNMVSTALYGLAALAALAALVLWLARSPWFAIRSIRIDGDLQRINGDTLRANAAPRLAGNFFSADLGRARAAFEAVPWVRRAVVRRVWPDRLVVHIEEHHAAALWQGDERDDRLVNRQGEVFSANVGDVEDEALPSFAGPPGSAASVLAMYRRLLPTLRTLDLEIEQMQLSTRGSWRVLLDSGATIELGRGSEDEVAARSERFVRTLSQVTSRYHAPLEYADLRHADGYAVRLRGVTTTLPGAKP